MKLIRSLMLIAATGALCCGVAAAAEKADETEVITAVPLTFSADGFSGPGAKLLRDGLDQTQFIMIGEAHGHAESPLLLSAFASEARRFGFLHYAVEVGPHSANWVQDRLRRGSVSDLSRALAGRPLAIPFLNSLEEARAALAFAESGNLWGVDQEFIGSPLIHLEILKRTPSNNPQLAERLEAAERQAFSSGNQGAVLFATIDAQGWQDLRDAYKDNVDALNRIAAMERSQRIYRAFFIGKGLENNLERVELIRNNFLDHYHNAQKASEKPPRVLMKFGATHAGRATSPMSTFDLGSLIEGMAASNDLEALHVAYLPIGGMTTAIKPSPDGAFSEKAVDADKLRSLLSEIGINLEALDVPGAGHFMIDLEAVKRRLGNEGLAELDPMTRFIVVGFDYLVTTSAATASTPLAS